jgi:hypothetical protein
MLKTYDKGQVDTSVRIQTEYKLNQAGANQYILDRIQEIDNCNEYQKFEFMYFRSTGALFAFFSVGLIDIFDFTQLEAKLALSFSRFADRFVSPLEQI